MFSWIPMYEEISRRLVDYRDRQGEIIGLLKQMHSQGITIFSMQDKNADGNALELEEIDPFTIFAAFNRGITTDNRQIILRRFKDFFGLKSDIPGDFDGIPIVMNFNSWFFWLIRLKRTRT